MKVEEFVARMTEIEQEADQAAQQSLARELTAKLERDWARATVDLVEAMRSHFGDEAAAKALQILRQERKGRLDDQRGK